MWVKEEWRTWVLFVVWVSCGRTSLLPLFSPVSAEGINFIYNSREIPHHYSAQSPGSEGCGFTMLKIQQINWTFLRSSGPDKWESYIFTTPLRAMLFPVVLVHKCKADVYLRCHSQSALLSAVCNRALYAVFSGAVSRHCPGYPGIKRASVCTHTAPLSSLVYEILN